MVAGGIALRLVTLRWSRPHDVNLEAARADLAPKPHWVFADNVASLHFTYIRGLVGQLGLTQRQPIVMNNSPEASQLMLLSQLSSAPPGTKVRFLGWFVYFSTCLSHPHSLTIPTKAWTYTTACQQLCISKTDLLPLPRHPLRVLQASMLRMSLMH